MLDYVLVSSGWVEKIIYFNIDDEGYLDIGSDHNLLFWYFIGQRTGDNMRYRHNDRKVRSEWQWRRGGEVDWSRFRTVAEE